ncbi:hypothetical protein DAPPUDRAFT_323133 [Daphnia pulex]|uniref:Uncharacterized protein n=1 Tax=Daphnia pulex TaxID=6669 RepID=E9GY02_DAPPU|nr:hypothetical protein DAPPUDRAFT_323133 [Daphnia pulex]|eukprot:EFX75646.1 hypothetical protein DAPPUDRAFT_323133 [Daphnia pulex]
MASVASLTSKRGGNRGAITRLIAKISDIIADASMDRDRKIHELNKKLDLYDKIKVVEALDTEIVELLAAAEVEDEMDSSGVVNMAAYDARDAAKFTLKKLMDEKAAEVAATANLNPPAATITPIINVTTATDSNIEILEDSESALIHPSSLKPPKNLNVMFTGATSSNKESKKRETPPVRKLYCPFCDGEHWPTDCLTVVYRQDS